MKNIKEIADKFFEEQEKLNISYDSREAFIEGFKLAKEMEKEQTIALLKSLVYSVCIGDDVEDVEEWLKEHELNKSYC